MNAETIQITLLKLKDGTRLLRLTEPESGLSLEKVVDATRSVLAQKKRLEELFKNTLEHALASAA